jgi:hypothetical protein
MPRRAINRVALREALISRLKFVGPQSRAELQRTLDVSQPTLSRMLRMQEERFVTVGKPNSPRYALRSGHSWPIFEVNTDGNIQELGELTAVEPSHFVIENNLFADLPYFLSDMRPSGFLGRLVPTLHPELTLPGDIRTWNAHTTLKYLSHAGFSPPGNLLVGEIAVQRFLHTERISRATSRNRYTAIADDILGIGIPGSSAAGEQPKFLVTNEDGVHLIVKFSPPLNESVGERMSDILVCEHIAMTLLQQSGIASAKTRVFRSGERTFLEVERFDRVGLTGRRGVLSLGALDFEFVGGSSCWSDAVEKLLHQKKVLPKWHQHVRFLELFGHLIANSDMHMFNLSFLSEHGTRILELAPVYDMCPMSYAPRANQLIPHQFRPPIPRKNDQQIWSTALPLALRFWKEVASDGLISERFQKIAKENICILERL